MRPAKCWKPITPSFPQRRAGYISPEALIKPVKLIDLEDDFSFYSISEPNEQFGGRKEKKYREKPPQVGL